MAANIETTSEKDLEPIDKKVKSKLEKWEKEFRISEKLELDERPKYDTQKIKAIIVNQKVFDNKLNLAERHGSEKDIKDLSNKFNRLNYSTVELNDCKLSDLKTKITKALKDHNNFNCFILVIMTHGYLDKLAAKDQFYNIKEIFNLLTEIEDKPKFIVINACRNEKIIQKQKCFFNTLTIKNTIVVYSTYPGTVSYRFQGSGSRLIFSFRKALDDLVKINDDRLLLDLLIDIKRHVATRPDANPQMPIIAFNIKKLFLIGKR